MGTILFSIYIYLFLFTSILYLDFGKEIAIIIFNIISTLWFDCYYCWCCSSVRTKIYTLICYYECKKVNK